jgi:hypothetical protein
MPTKRYLALSFLLLLAHGPLSFAQSRADLYTMGPGDELFTKFGHVSLCVTLSGQDVTLCYNYGVTDFSRPVGLTLDVLRGRAEFFVVYTTEHQMLDAYRYEDRTVYRQILPFSEEQVLRLAQKLDEDARPENRAYTYDHFLDNCSTKPRDLIDEITGGALSSMTEGENLTYRELVDGRLGYSRLLKFGSDLFLGRSLDIVTTPYEAMFLPPVLRDAVKKQLGVVPEVVYTRQKPLTRPDVATARRWNWFVLAGLALAASLSILSGSDRAATATRTVVGCTFGGLGVLLLLVAAISPEPAMRFNENLLVFLATDLVYVTGRRKLIEGYGRFRVVALGLVGVLSAAGVLLQPLWTFWIAVFLPTVSILRRFRTP